MATPVFMEGGGDASAGLDFFTNLSGSVSIETTVTNGFPHSILVDSGTSTANVKVTGIMADAGRRVSYRFRFSALPGGNSTKIIAAEQNTGVYPVALLLRSDGTLALQCAGQTLTGTSVLAPDTWYRISFAYVIGADTSAEVRVFLNGTLELTLSAASGATTGTANIRIGWFTGSPGTNVLGYLRDIYIDDGTTLDDVGDVYVTVKLPAASGAANAFDTPTGGPLTHRWDYVTERPFNTTNALTHTATTDVAENFQLQAAAAGDHDMTNGTVVGLLGYIDAAKGSGTGTTAADLTLNGVDYPIADTDLTTSYKILMKPVAASSYPAATAGIGMRSTGVDADTLLADAGVMVAYIPGTGPTILNGSAALSGTGTLTATAQLELQGTLPLTGAGTLAATGQVELHGTLVLTGDGTLTADGQGTQGGAAAFTGTSTLTAQGQLELTGTLTLLGGTTMTAAGQGEQTGTATLSGTATLQAEGRGEQTGTATLAGNGTLTAAGHMELAGTLTLAGSGTLTTDGQTGAGGTLALTGTGTLSAQGALELHGTLTLAGGGTLTVANFVGVPFGVLTATLTVPGHLLIATANAGLLLDETADPGVLALSTQAPGALTLTQTLPGSLSLA